MKKILGLDLGTNSIGWALVNEAEDKNEQSKIIKLGVRVNPLTTDEKTDFEKGRPLSVNADRTLKRGARRNLQRFKLRRKYLINILKEHNIIDGATFFTEVGKGTTHQTLKLRAKSAKERIELEDFAKVLLAINKKRGYKSSRKAVNEEDGVAIDGMAVAKEMFESNLTPGQYVLQLLKTDKKNIPDFYRSDLSAEFNTVWQKQQTFYPDILNDELYKALAGKNKSQTWAICQKPFNIVGIKLEGKAKEQKLKRYELRSLGITAQLDLEHLAIVLQEINNDLNKSSGYLGGISDRSKELYFNKITVGQYLYGQINKDPHSSLRNQVFYRQDYLDEFEQIWNTQAKYHSILTNTLKEEIRDVIIFYQRRLKSQKHLISNCPFEKYHKAVPKSSPLFQEFKIWQSLNNLEFKNDNTKEIIKVSLLEEEIRQNLFNELNIRGELKPKEILTNLKRYLELGTLTAWKCNFEKIEGNRTNQVLYDVYRDIIEAEGYGFDWSKKSSPEIKEELKAVFSEIGIKPDILDFDPNKEGVVFDKQESYQLWHLLYSAEDDHKISEEDKLVYGNSNVALKKKIKAKYGFKPDYAKWLANVKLQQEYGSLSSRAIRKILPFLQSGNTYSEACAMAGYNHSNFLTREELNNRALKAKLELLPKNSLRNPVVEKILNQMVNLVNQVITTYGKPDEVRIELARELKKSATERKDEFLFISKRTRENNDIKKLIVNEFGIPNPTKTDVTRYRLYEELKDLGYKTVFTNTYIPKEKLFSKEIDIEHIIPKAMLFDDSFSNKTLAFKKINLQKRDRTAIDFIESDFNKDLENYQNRVESLYNKGKGLIGKGKYKKLLMSQQNLTEGFIERDLRNSQYIAKKAKLMLQELVREPIVSTSGKITDKLREDWDLINVMKELNLSKYRALGLTEIEERKDNKKIEVIKDWTKRNDHRHHAMDALTVAFTTHNHIQYLNNLNARKDQSHDKYSNIVAIEKLITYRNKEGKKRFVSPMSNFRMEAKEHIESILISFKTKNKVVTKNVNKTKLRGKDNYTVKTQLTPRGQLHKETVYGRSKQPMDKPIKLNKRTTIEQVNTIINPKIKQYIKDHLNKFDNNVDIAFDTKTLKKTPLLFNNEPLKEIWCFEDVYTIRKEIGPDLKVDKVIDKGIKDTLKNRLEAFGNNAKEAFSNLDKNPIWLNKEKGISIKRVTISGVSNVEALHEKRDHFGNLILDKKGAPIQNDFVSTGNNHHVAIYIDYEGKIQDRVVSFFEAVQRVNSGLTVIDKDYNSHLGWRFLFSMKQNELFVFPSKEFNPFEIDLMEKNNAKLISPHLFRVQKFSKVEYGNSAVRDYVFRHHLETMINDNKELRDTSYKVFKSISEFEFIVKVRTNHLGQIVQVGEY
ncbi:type II CRISPR RNA-guided endonuclease Cas9 [Seonamhaeicola marinus]|uniref:CRISPR-associated endonuclease Cas9 n=1 Tax=Seonamhaeicola marinus TaxID=1912246 RepID=A0A5D0I4T1_9FLAO|nr:type II CRISPR RNA-guided endonuclease Cas9 [Seonamhaeicola marinus]TYA78684.1 type II CRISPR RNA-guided endonuclease Cas9 [Seonamhaeicola marinus]